MCIQSALLRPMTHWCGPWAFWTICSIWATLGNFWKSKADVLICAEFSTLLPCPLWTHSWARFANWLVYWWKPLTNRSWKKGAMVWIHIHYVEFLTPSVMVLGGAAFRRGLGGDSGALLIGLVPLWERTQRASSALPWELTEKLAVCSPEEGFHQNRTMLVP